MRHAFLIITHSEPSILDILLKKISRHDADTYIHCDKKASASIRKEIKRITTKWGGRYIENNMKVYWGDISMVQCELMLFKKAYQGNYDYYHLLSGSDLPIKPISEFLTFIESNRGKEFYSITDDLKIDKRSIENTDVYYFFRKYGRGSSIFSRLLRFIERKIIRIQALLRISRCSEDDFKMYKGHQWCSLSNEAVKLIIENEDWINRRFRFTSCPDEIYKQTILMRKGHDNDRFTGKVKGQSSCLRQIDWERGRPYTYTINDKEELIRSNNYFARKFSTNVDRAIIDWIDETIPDVK